MKKEVAFVAIAGILTGCQEGSLTFERMVTQRRVDRYQETPFFPDGRALRELPPGTLPRGSTDQSESVRLGTQDGTPVAAIPVKTTPESLAEGQRRFLVHCAPCHGPQANGQSVVAQFMTLQPPRSLIAPPVSNYPPGRVFQRITDGYRFMRSYQEIDVNDRWAVVQYIKSLQITAHGSVGDRK